MKTLRFLLIAFMVITLGACSSTKQVTEADIINHRLATERLENKQFLIKANRLILNKHSFPGISSSTNFVMVEDDNATIQVSPGVAGGPNGVGGFTVKGRITGYEFKTKPNGEVNVKFNVNASVGSCIVFINLTKNGNEANININNNLQGKTAILSGQVLDVDNSVFVGRTPY